MHRLRIRRWFVVLAAGAGWCVAAADNPPGPAAAVVAGPEPPADPLVARVNGEPITRGELEAGMPKPGPFGTFFARDLDRLRQGKLDRLICAHALAQFLKAAGIEVTAAEIDAQVAQLRRTPPSSGCSCCRYASLEEFMDALAMDLQELRRGIANDLGTQRYLDARWDKEYPTAAQRAALLATEKPQLEQGYLKASHIFFNTFQNPRFDEDPDEVRQATRNKAEAAWRRLEAGERFEAVAMAVSDDALSKVNGGALGCIPREALGKQFAAAVAALEPGRYGCPVESPWGWHIVRREPITDADLLGLVREDILGRWWAEEKRRLVAEARIERFDD